MSDMVPRIVVPTDGSEFSMLAVGAALDLARTAGLPITLFGVAYDEYDRDEILLAITNLHLPADGDLAPDIKVVVAGALAYVDGYVARSIVDEAKRDGALVCIASHGRSGLGSTVLGSTTEQLLRESQRPTLVVGRHFRSRPRSTTDGRLVVCVDGSELAEHALGPAIAWASQFKTTPWIVQVIPPPGIDFVDADVDESNYVQGLARLVPCAESEVLHAHDVGCEFANLPERWPVDAYVMVSHDRSGLSRLFLGSIAMTVVHHTSRPVLIVPKAPAELAHLPGRAHLATRG